eukprot:CAMPEP_0172155968 /NCGR_PEP_ID=MMETSP1050-20130122/2927_1 /TAXON_ID=233186 /ORGANISM="Cryptomonas curvata, Strain CCAP979/52" /LENGTH=931 /DNA_ID=CAMNT_0012824939 /DNA_START=1785 /DNA_END=4577 /DNA_ORIENTATION=+
MIMISMQSIVPLRAACNPVVTLSGLISTDSVDDNIVLVQSSDVFGSSAAWSQSTGQLTLVISADMLANTTYYVSFVVKNLAVNQSSPVWIQSSGMPIARSQLNTSAGGVAFYTVDFAYLTSFSTFQSSPWPCDENLITVSILSNTGLLRVCAPTLTMRGLIGFQNSTSRSLTLSNTAITSSSNPYINNTWNGTAGELTVDMKTFMADDVVPLSSFSFKFNLTNPTVARQALGVSISASMSSVRNLAIKQQLTYNTWQSISAPTVNNLSFTPDRWLPYSDLAPNRGQQDWFVGYVRTINITTFLRQDKPVNTLSLWNYNNVTDPCSPVVITVQVSSSVPLFRTKCCSTKITISGLAGSASNITSWSSTGVLDVDNSSSLDPSGSGTLILSLNGDMMAGQTALVYLNLTQKAAPFVGVKSSAVIVRSGPCISATAFTVITACGENVPFRVRSVNIATFSIMQYSPFPCDNNRLEIRLSSTVPIYSLCRPAITIYGLSGTNSNSSSVGTFPVYDLGTSSLLANGMGNWTQETGILILTLATSNFSTGSFDPSQPSRGGPSGGAPFAMDWGFIFWIINPSSARNSAAVSVVLGIADVSGSQRTPIFAAAIPSGVPSANWTSYNQSKYNPQLQGSDAFISKVSTFGPNTSWAPQDGDSRPLQIRSFRFVQTSIGQSTPFPCDDNIIQVTLSTNVPLIFQGSLCTPHFTIRGLTGSQSVSANLSANQDKIAFATPLPWNRIPGELLLPVLSRIQVGTSFGISAGTVYVFSISLTNQAQPQDPPAISITSSLSFGQWSQMSRDGTTVLPQYEAQLGDAQPLKIFAARLITKKIGQSVPYPGCLNTLTITLRTNVDLIPTNCPSFLRIFNLRDASTSTNTDIGNQRVQPGILMYPPSGLLSLSGQEHVYSIDGASWLAPGSCNASDKQDFQLFKDSCSP